MPTARKRRGNHRAGASKRNPAADQGRSLKPGDQVEWSTPQGTTRGKVVAKVKRPMSIKSHRVAASPGNPEYLVESATSGKRAAHKKAALRKR